MRSSLWVATVVVLAMSGLVVGPVSAVTQVVDTTRVSGGLGGLQADGSSLSVAMSADGEKVAFTSDATNLVPGDTNSSRDVFVYDLKAGTTTRVSVATGGAQANSSSDSPAISADGGTVTFISYATNLVAGDDNSNGADLFMHKLATGVTTRVSVAPDGSPADYQSGPGVVSADGGFIAFGSEAANLVASDGNGSVSDVFLRAVGTGESMLVSLAADGGPANDVSWVSAISADGGTIVYESNATNLVAGDTNGATDVFAYDVTKGITTRVSVATGGGQANSSSEEAAMSADGGTIVYMSHATNLVAGDTNGDPDVFAYDTATALTTRVSVASDGAQISGWTTKPAISADGGTIGYTSLPSGGNLDVFVYDRPTGVTTRVSTAPDGSPSNAWSNDPALSSDGTAVAYWSLATNLISGDTNGVADVFVTRLNRSPSASGFAATVAEDVAVGTELGVVVGLDPDGDALAYSITVGNGAGLFALGSGTGVVTVAKALDYETATKHTLTVTVSDGTLTGTGLVTVTVTDVNESVPPPAYSFSDDDGSVFEADIEWLAASGITRGCNPPANTMFCPNNSVTRGQMAAFLHRALPDLPVVRAAIYFTDDDDSVFEADIEWLYSVGVTQGNSPTTFNPNGAVTRGQMAAFLVRALKYTDNGGGDLFVDDDSSQFRGDIDRLGTAGVTRGCNPPTNDKYCPDAPVTRAAMAAFLHRALGG